MGTNLLFKSIGVERLLTMEDTFVHIVVANVLSKEKDVKILDFFVQEQKYKSNL